MKRTFRKEKGASIMSEKNKTKVLYTHDRLWAAHIRKQMSREMDTDQV